MFCRNAFVCIYLEDSRLKKYTGAKFNMTHSNYFIMCPEHLVLEYTFFTSMYISG